MTRTHRERLVSNSFIKEVIKGWHVPAHPDEPAGESTAWYTHFGIIVPITLNQDLEINGVFHLNNH